MTQDELKQAVAKAAIDYIAPKLDAKDIVGVGTGSTANFFIDYLAEIKGSFDGFSTTSSGVTAASVILIPFTVSKSVLAQIN